MKILVLDSGVHVNATTLRQQFPADEIVDATTEAEALTVCADCEVIISTSHLPTDRLIAAMPRLGYFLSLTTGVDHIWTLKSLSPAVRITNARGVHGPQMAELAFLFMLGLARNVKKLLRNQERRSWDRWPQPLLYRKTVVLVGLGAIAGAIAARCHAFGMTVIGISDARTSFENCETIYPRSRLQEAAALADFVIILVPLDAATEGLINADVFAAMKPTACLINIARGPVVDEAALVAALQAGRIAGAGLDVFVNEPPRADSPLWSMDNVMMTPRIGGMSDCYAEQVLPLIVHNLRAWRTGQYDDMLNIVR
jgi:D-2-hydroxyacid dehydrogenase (NADP+)